MNEDDDAEGRGWPDRAACTAEWVGDGGREMEVLDVNEEGSRVLSYTTDLSGAREVASAVCWMVCMDVPSMELVGSNIKEFSGPEGQESGMAGRSSSGSMESTSFLSLDSCSLFTASKRSSRFLCAICRGASILLPCHIQEYFSAFLRFCLSNNL